MAEQTMPVCDVCGDDSIEFVQDIKEVAPQKDGKVFWQKWERDGPRRFFCLKHMRAGKTTELSQKERESLCPAISG